MSYALLTGVQYYISSAAAPHKVLGCSSRELLSGTRVVLWDNDSTDNQRWIAEHRKDGSWSFSPAHAPGQRLDSNTEVGKPCHIWDTADPENPNQKWTAEATFDGSYILRRSQDGAILSISGEAVNGCMLHLSTVDSATPNQRWILRPLGAPFSGIIYHIVPRHAPNKVIGCANRGVKSGTQLVLWEDDGDANQHWKAVERGGELWSFHPMHAPGQLLDGHNGYNLRPCHIWDPADPDNPNQKWILEPVDSYHFIFHKEAGGVLEVANGAADNGSLLYTTDQITRGANQQFAFQAVGGQGHNTTRTSRPVTPSAQGNQGQQQTQARPTRTPPPPPRYAQGHDERPVTPANQQSQAGGQQQQQPSQGYQQGPAQSSSNGAVGASQGQPQQQQQQGATQQQGHGGAYPPRTTEPIAQVEDSNESPLHPLHMAVALFSAVALIFCIVALATPNGYVINDQKTYQFGLFRMCVDDSCKALEPIVPISNNGLALTCTRTKDDWKNRNIMSQAAIILAAIFCLASMILSFLGRIMVASYINIVTTALSFIFLILGILRFVYTYEAYLYCDENYCKYWRNRGALTGACNASFGYSFALIVIACGAQLFSTIFSILRVIFKDWHLVKEDPAAPRVVHEERQMNPVTQERGYNEPYHEREQQPHTATPPPQQATRQQEEPVQQRSTTPAQQQPRAITPAQEQQTQQQPQQQHQQQQQQPVSQQQPQPQRQPEPEPEPAVEEEIFDPRNLQPYDWVYDDECGLYWSEQEFLYLDPNTRHYYDPKSDQWYDPEEDRWYYGVEK
jgi:hypothetical protein